MLITLLLILNSEPCVCGPSCGCGGNPCACLSVTAFKLFNVAPKVAPQRVITPAPKVVASKQTTSAPRTYYRPTTRTGVYYRPASKAPACST